MLLIAMRFFRKNWQIVITLVTVVVMPTLSMTMTFMSENIYFPLCMWNFYCCIVVMEQTKKTKKIVGSVLVGVLNYLLYLNKEIALAFFIAYILMEGKEALTEKSRRRLTAFGLTAAIVSFGICFLVMKLTIFRGMGNSYNQMSIDAIASVDRFGFMLYAVLYNGLFALIAFFIFPVVLPVMRWKYFDEKEKRAFAYVLLSFLIMVFVIAYTISVREDWGKEAIRQHLRYLEPLFLLFFVCFFSALTKQMSKQQIGKWILLLPAALSIFIVFVPDRIGIGSPVDGCMLRYYELAQNVLGGRLIILRIAMAVLVMGISILVYDRNRTIITAILIAGMWGICIVNNVAVYDLLVGNYKVSSGLLEDWYELNSFMEETDEELLVIMRDWYENEAKVMDTFMEVKADYMAVSETDAVKESLQNVKNYTYLLIGPPRGVAEGEGEEIMKVGSYTLYKVSDSKAVNIVEKPCFPRNSHEQRTVTATEGKFHTQFGMKEGKYSYISGKDEGFLVHGPYTKIYPGTYDITVYYEYEGEADAEAVIGRMDVRYSEEEPEGYVELKAGSNVAELKNVVVEELYESGEVRIYTTASGVRFLKAEIYRH